MVQHALKSRGLYGASDSAPMPTMCALQMFVLLSLLVQKNAVNA